MKNSLFYFLILFGFTSQSQVYKTMTSQEWEFGAWVNDYRQLNSVDGAGYLVKTRNENWNHTDKVWRLAGETTYTNSATGKPVRTFYQYWNYSQNTFIPSSTEQYTYNANNNVQVYVKQTMSSGTLTNFRMTNYIYNSKGFLSSEEIKVWQSGAWVNESKTTYTNNSDGDPTQILIQEWNSGSWKNEAFYTLTFHSLHTINSFVAKAWINSAWVNSHKKEIIFDQFGSLTSDEYYIWFNNDWVMTERSTRTNYEDGKEHFTISETLDDDMTWENRRKYIYEWFGSGPTGIADYSIEEISTPSIYFDLSGRQVDRQKNVLLIEQRGSVRRKVIIRE